MTYALDGSTLEEYSNVAGALKAEKASIGTDGGECKLELRTYAMVNWAA